MKKPPLLQIPLAAGMRAPPNTHFLTCETAWKKSIWLHGTSSGHLAGIAAHGILPREKQETAGNWSVHPSCPSVVYLTTAYALHYAQATKEPGFRALLEIDLSQLPKDRFFADEDSYALSKVQDMPELDALSVDERVKFWRDNLVQTDPEVGLRILGNACYMGVVPPQAVKGVRLLTPKESLTMTIQISDPVVSPQNFKIMGGAAQRFNRWLLGHKTELNGWFEQVCKPSLPVMSLQEAVVHHKSLQS